MRPKKKKNRNTNREPNTGNQIKTTIKKRIRVQKQQTRRNRKGFMKNPLISYRGRQREEIRSQSGWQREGRAGSRSLEWKAASRSRRAPVRSRDPSTAGSGAAWSRAGSASGRDLRARSPTFSNDLSSGIRWRELVGTSASDPHAFFETIYLSLSSSFPGERCFFLGEWRVLLLLLFLLLVFSFFLISGWIEEGGGRVRRVVGLSPSEGVGKSVRMGKRGKGGERPFEQV